MFLAEWLSLSVRDCGVLASIFTALFLTGLIAGARLLEKRSRFQLRVETPAEVTFAGGSVRVRELRKVCAWCATETELAAPNVTHGICEQCLEGMLNKMEREEAQAHG